MKKVASIILIATLIFSLTPVTSTEAVYASTKQQTYKVTKYKKPKTMYTASKKTPVYSKPSKSSKKVDTLPGNVPVKVIGTTKDSKNKKWYVLKAKTPQMVPASDLNTLNLVTYDVTTDEGHRKSLGMTKKEYKEFMDEIYELTKDGKDY